MGVKGSRDHQSIVADTAESQGRLEISVLEAFRNAARGDMISIPPILLYAESLASAGQTSRALDVLETAVRFQDAVTNEEHDALRLRTVKMMIETGDPSRSVDLLVRLLSQDGTAEPIRTQALLYLAEVSALSGDYGSAADALSPVESESEEPSFNAPKVVMARAVYLNLAGDAARALDVAQQYLSRQPQPDVHGMCLALIQCAWSLTNSGRFNESDKVLQDPLLEEHGYSNVLRYIGACNAVGIEGHSFGRAMRDALALCDARPGAEAWLGRFFAAWSAFASGDLLEAQELFNRLPTDPTIEPALNGTRDQLALQGKAHTALALRDYDAAFAAFRQLCAYIPVRPVPARFQILINAYCYGWIATKLNSILAVETLSEARRCAQIALGLDSPVVPRLMDLEAELLLAGGHSGESRATRTLALELIDNGSGNLDRDMLVHELGLCLVDVQENKNDTALKGLRAVLPAMHEEFGRHHEKTVVARYALASLARSGRRVDTAEADFEGLYEDLVETFGSNHLFTLKSRYGIARDLQGQGDFLEALDMYQEINALLPDLPQNYSFGVSVKRRIGESHRALHQYDAAHSAFTDAIKLLNLSIAPAPQRRLQIELDLNECLVKRGSYRPPMHFFADKASQLRGMGLEMSTEYFRAVKGYASCLEHLANHQGAAHNYGHLVRLVDNGMFSGRDEIRRQIYIAAAWNNELSANFEEATEQYDKALLTTAGASIGGIDRRWVTDIEHRIACCRARLPR